MAVPSSLSEIQTAIRSGSLTCHALTEFYLSNIKAKETLNAFVEVFENEALEKAREIDKKFAEGKEGKLAGMVVGIKDVLCYKEHHTTAGSNILKGFRSKFTATAVQRLIDEDAIIIGRQNCDEFAMGASGETSAYGPTLNPHDTTRVPGGSSSGSAAAVQADMCTVSLGTDTGGSVRQPAAFCGTFGLKPTYSRVSRHGLIAYGSSFDCVGVLAKNIENCAITLEVIAGKDQFDATSSSRAVPSYSAELEWNKKARITYLKETVENDALSVDIKTRTKHVLEKLKQAGHTVEAVDFPLLEHILPAYYILATAEAGTNLSRFDGVRYGFRAENVSDTIDMYKKTRSEGFGEEVKRRIMLGTFVLSSDYHDTYFTKAQKVRRIILEETKKLLSSYDFLILPITPTTAFKIGDFTENPVEMYYSDLFTVQANITGIPAISIPNGKDENGLPIGLQIAAGHFKEKELLAFADYVTHIVE